MTELLLIYIFYGVIILLGLIVLGILRKKTRPPTYETLQKRLEALSQELRALSKPPKNGYDFFPRVVKVFHRLGKLIYDSVMLEQKERDSDMSYLTSLLEGAQQDLNPYRFEKTSVEIAGIEAAQEKIETAIRHLEKIRKRNILLQKRHF